MKQLDSIDPEYHPVTGSALTTHAKGGFLKETNKKTVSLANQNTSAPALSSQSSFNQVKNTPQHFYTFQTE